MNQTQQPKIDCVVRVVTPENIEFEYMLAGPFQRLPAFLVDFGLRATVFTVVVILGLLVGIPLTGDFGMAITLTIAFLTFFALSWLYGTFMEAQFNGRTVGKLLFSLRAISSDGRPINASQAALRNLLRLGDFMPPLSLTLLFPDAPPANLLPTCFVGLAAMTLTTRMQRVGDLAAGTMVVWEGRRGYNANLQPEDPRTYELAELIPPTFQISRTLARAVALYMERRTLLSPMRREEIASNLAEPLLQQFNLRSDTSADLLLCAIYVRVYHSAQQREAKMAAARAIHSARSRSSESAHGRSSPALLVARDPVPHVHPTNTQQAPAEFVEVTASPLELLPSEFQPSELPPSELQPTELPPSDAHSTEELPIIVARAVEPYGSGVENKSDR